MGRKKIAAGLVLYSYDQRKLKVLLVHPGGPLFKNKDDGFWGIPKGEPDEKEDNLLDVAKREFEEETGMKPPTDVQYIALGTIQQKGGKVVHAWAFEGSWEKDRKVNSNLFTMEWPPKSGKIRSFPEVDAAALLTVRKAKSKIREAQFELIERLDSHLRSQEKLD